MTKEFEPTIEIRQRGHRFIARIREFPGLAAFGSSEEEARANIPASLNAYQKGLEHLHRMKLDMVEAARRSLR